MQGKDGTDDSWWVRSQLNFWGERRRRVFLGKLGENQVVSRDMWSAKREHDTGEYASWEEGWVGLAELAALQ